MDQSIIDEDTHKIPSVQIQKVDNRANIAGTVSLTWWEALKEIAPIYIATHIAFLALTYLAVLFSLSNFSSNALNPSTLLYSWDRWDSSQFTHIAVYGYDAPYRTAFFPLYPILEHVLAFVVRNPFIAGLLISNLATLGMFMVLYRLVAEDFDRERAWRSVLYLAIFPTAFFFATAYNESLFLFFAILSFFFMRKGSWWLAGLAALFASLTRSIAVCLVIPFAYEYIRQHDFQWRDIRFDLLSAAGIGGGVIIFMVYSYLAFHDPLAFSHAEAGGDWQRHLSVPWSMFIRAIGIIRHSAPLTFSSVHTVMDLSASLFILLILVLAFVGPWKLAKSEWSYGLYAGIIYLFLILVPEGGSFPVASMGRFMLELFPAFIILAAMGKKRNFNLYYLAICLPLLAFLVLQWVTGNWIV